ncbi:MAG: hypothetical protein ACR2GT_14225 [Gaiellaceae bacterium]
MRTILVLAVLIVFVPTALAGAVRAVTAPAPVLAVAFDGARVAVASGRSASDCNRVYVWNLATRGVSKLGRKTHCEQTSTGNTIAALSIAGTRVLWLHYVGGNSRDWSLWTATTAKPAPIRLRLVTREADAAAPIVLGRSGGGRPGDLLPYAVERTVVALRPNGARRISWTAPARVIALDALEDRLAVAVEGGAVVVLDGNGRELRTEMFARTVDAVRLTRTGLVAQSGRSLELREGGSVRKLSLPAGARLADATSDRAILIRGGKVLRLELDTGHSAVIASGTTAALAGERLAVGSGRRVTLTAFR